MQDRQISPTIRPNSTNHNTRRTLLNSVRTSREKQHSHPRGDSWKIESARLLSEEIHPLPVIQSPLIRVLQQFSLQQLQRLIRKSPPLACFVKIGVSMNCMQEDDVVGAARQRHRLLAHYPSLEILRLPPSGSHHYHARFDQGTKALS
ncbi:MAG: hypothetical protein ACI8Z5_001449 [Lentimonas sp.]|jgi:hypothetical protein